MAAVRWRACPGELPVVLGREGRGGRVRRKGRGRMVGRKGKERTIGRKGRGGTLGRKGRGRTQKSRLSWASQPPSPSTRSWGTRGDPAAPLAEHPAPLTCLRGLGGARGVAAGTGGQGRHGSPALPLRCPVQALLLRKEAREKPVGKGTAGVDPPTLGVTSGGQRAPAEVTSCCSRSALE